MPFLSDRSKQIPERTLELIAAGYYDPRKFGFVRVRSAAEKAKRDAAILAANPKAMAKHLARAAKRAAAPQTTP